MKKKKKKNKEKAEKANKARRVIDRKITTIYVINIFYIFVLIAAMLVFYGILDKKNNLLNKYNDQNQASLQLNSLLSESGAEILNIIYNRKNDLISELFARNENIFSVLKNTRIQPKNTALLRISRSLPKMNRSYWK